MSAPAPYRRIDTTDPRRHDLSRPFTLPGAWADDRAVLYDTLLASGTVFSGAAMLLKSPVIAYAGLIVALAHLAGQRPLQKKRESGQGMAGPGGSIVFSLLSVIMLAVQKAMGAPSFEHAVAKATGNAV